MLNKVVEDYVLMESVGKGQYGNVYRAEHRKTKEIFAVKVMSVDKFKHTPKLSQFTNNEICILTKINHPNIIKFKEMLRTNNNYYLVYQFCNGGTLADYIKSKKRLSQEEALKIFVQLRSAFQTLSKNQILHRDLKPTNILFHNQNGIVKIADFGFCKEMLNNELAQTMVGSPIYMAPQVLKGSVYDNRADIWSLGVILYEMIYGFCPYEESSISSLICLIDNTILKFPPQVQISSNTKNLLTRMMTLKYRSRITAQQLIAYPLSVKDGSEFPGRIKQNSLTLRDIICFHRKNMVYLVETLNFLANKIEKDQKYSNICYLVYKFLVNMQKKLKRGSNYWQNIKIENNNEDWDPVLNTEFQMIEPFGQNIKQLILCSGATLPMKQQLENATIDFKFYYHLLTDFINDSEARLRLVNSLLIYRHFILVQQKKLVDFTDHIEVKKLIEQKEELCKKFSYQRT